MPPVLWCILPESPDDGVVAARSIRVLLPLFGELLDEAPLRVQSRHSAEGAGDEDDLG